MSEAEAAAANAQANNDTGHFLWVSEERIKANYSSDQVLSSELNNSMVIGRLSSGLDEDKSSETLTNSVHNSQDLSYSIESERTGVGGGGGVGVAGGGLGSTVHLATAVHRLSGTVSDRSSLRLSLVDSNRSSLRASQHNSNRSSFRASQASQPDSNRNSISSHEVVRTDRNCNIYNNGHQYYEDNSQSPSREIYDEDDLFDEERDTVADNLDDNEGYHEDDVDEAVGPTRPKLSATKRWSVLARGTSLGLFDGVRII